MRDYRHLIPVSALVTFGVLTLGELEEHERLPHTRQYLGLAVAYFVIAALGDLGVPLAGGFAVLTMVAVLLAKGDKALAYVTGKAEGKRPARRRKGARQAPVPDSEALEQGGLTMAARANGPIQPVQPLDGQEL